MKEKRINYSRKYSKLSKEYHTTIRKHQNWKFGMILPEFVKGKYIQDVKVIRIERKTLESLNLDFLIADTDDQSREIIYETFNSMKELISKRYNVEFKPYDFLNDIFTIYYFKVVKASRRKKISDYF